MTLTGVLNTMADNTLANASSILSGSTGTIIVTMIALGILSVLIYKFRGLFGSAR